MLNGKWPWEKHKLRAIRRCDRSKFINLSENMCEIEYQPKAVVPNEVRNCVDKKLPFLCKINVDFRSKSPIIVNKMIGDRIKQARLAKGATLEEVAQLLTDRDAPITKAGLSKYEKNKSIPSQTFMIQLANVLSVKPSFFVAEPEFVAIWHAFRKQSKLCLLYTSPSPRDQRGSRMPSSA